MADTFSCGHPTTEENTRYRRDRRPFCRECAMLRERARSKRRRDETRKRRAQGIVKLPALPKKSARITDIVRCAARIGMVSVEDLLGPQRSCFVMRPRLACYLIARRCGHSYAKIGRHMKRDHSSVMSGYNKALGLMEKDGPFSRLVVALEKESQSVEPMAPFAAVKTVKVELKPVVRSVSAKNDFISNADAWERSQQANIVKGSQALLDAIRKAAA